MASMTSPPSLLIWFLLLDPDTGLPYKETSVSSVLRSSLEVPVVDQFRDAVKAKYNQPSYLQDIPSSTLLVYKNKAAFDKRNSIVNDDGHLEEDTLLDGLGRSKKEALVVVVPTSMTQIRPTDVFTPCNLPFYNNVCNATESDGWLLFEHDIPSSKLNRLFVRDSYRSIASSIRPGLNKSIITGTPGIGKSLFLIYLLWKMVQEGKRIFIVYHPVKIYYDGKGNVFEVTTLPPTADHAFWASDLHCLFDAKNKKEMHLEPLPYEWCPFVLSTSPQRDIVNDYKKDPVPQVFYMPTWTQTEMEAIAPQFPNANEWRERFEILGGIPRHVLQITEKSPTKMLEAACKSCSLDDCINEIGLDSELTEKSKAVHLLIHVISTFPYTSSSVDYASQTALNIIVQKKGFIAKTRMIELLAACDGNPLTAALCGYIFEPYAIELLEKGG